MVDHVEQGRRNILAYAGATALLSIGGCCSLRAYPTDSSMRELPSKVDTRFAPSSIQHRSGGPRVAVDAHAHFFNGTDVSVQGYLSGPIAHGIQDKRLAALMRALAPIADQLVHLAPTAAVEYNDLLDNKKVFGLDAAMMHKTKVADELFKAIKGSEVEVRYREYTGDAKSVLTLELVRQAILGRARMRSTVASLSAADNHVAGLFEFVGHMLSPRWINLHDYVENYSTAAGSFGMDGVLCATVDFDHFLFPPKRSSQNDQMQLASLLSLMSGGYMLPLTAYNPWTHVKEGSAYLDRIAVHVEKLGAVGVKIYPPMGFYPMGNAELPPNPRRDVPSGKDLDSHLTAFFSRCIELGVPVMAHGNESCGVDADADRFGGPAGWEKLIATMGKRSPMVNIGHFGGASANSSSNWSVDMAKLMALPGGDRIYGDLGYWDALTECKNDDGNHCANALLRLNQVLEASPAAGARIMYGSDWFMLSKEVRWDLYPEKMLEALVAARDTYPGLKKLDIDRLFFENLIACFNLGRQAGAKPAANRERVEDFLRLHGVPVPKWLPA